MTDSDTPTNPAGAESTADAAPQPVSEPPSVTPELPPVDIGSAAGAAAGPVPEQAPQSRPSKDGSFWGVGRRKSAVARVRVKPGDGKILINKREVDHYFVEPQERIAVHEPLIATESEKRFDVFANVHGGGHKGQAGAIRLGLARALVAADTRHEATLRDKNYLTRDARVVERKKYGRRKARRRFQFSKR